METNDITVYTSDETNYDLLDFAAKLCVEHKLDMVKVGNIEIKKTIHKPDPVVTLTAEQQQQKEDAELFHSGV
jgi:hypothetical protein